MIIWRCLVFFFFMQKTAYEMRISDCSSDVFSSDLLVPGRSLHDRARDPALHGQGQGEDQWRRGVRVFPGREARPGQGHAAADRKSVGKGKSVSVRLDLGGRRIIKHKITITTAQSPM